MRDRRDVQEVTGETIGEGALATDTSSAACSYESNRLVPKNPLFETRKNIVGWDRILVFFGTAELQNGC
jgi:hypothetical protein